MPEISYQLYCSRKFPPLADTLAMLARTGYARVEGYGGLYADLDGLVAGLQANGLTMSSGHFGLDMLEQEPARALAVATATGMTRVYCPHIGADQRPRDIAGWRAFGQRLQAAGRPFRDAGLVFGWHNHDFELADLGGVTPLDLIAEADLALELDLGWVRVAGHDPVAWIQKYAGRITSVHIKDIARAGTGVDEDGWADVGHGIMDWAGIHAALAAAGITHYVVEHDNPKDHARLAARSLASIKAW